ncbi:MAG: hypothetical protein JNM84_01770 [Planctomycetes bacterium]|nr:hypothetical protein [Planctomycetota bacterium]
MTEPEQSEPREDSGGMRPAEGLALRERLRELGYLQDPLARFLSQGAQGPQSLTRSYVEVGAKVGVVLGLLFFALLAAGFAAAGRFVLLDTRDLMLFHAYLLLLALPLGVLIGLLLAAFFALYARFSRRALTKVALAARKCAVIVALGTLGYLLLAWLRLRENLIGAGWFTDLAAAAVCAGSAWLVGRATFAAALYLGARRRRRDPLEIEPPKRGLYSLLALLVLLAFGFAALLLAGRPQDRLPREAFQVERDARAVLLLGIDGLELDAVQALVREGSLPHFRALLEEGALCRLADEEPKHPLRWWTGLSTGFAADRHGIAGPTHERPRGLAGSIFVPDGAIGFAEVLDHVMPLLELSSAAPFSAGLLLEKSALEIASDASVGAATVNWWMTHPVNAALPAQQLSELAIWQSWSREGAPAANAATPSELGALLARVGERPALSEQLSASERAIRSARALDRSAAAVGTALLEAPSPPRFAQIGFFGANALHDALRGEHLSLVAERERVAALIAHVAELDALLGRLRAALLRAHPEAVLCLVASPPTQRTPDGPRIGLGGWCVFAGAGLAEAARRPRELARFDLVPTLLRLLGCPVSAEMPGQSIAERLFGVPERERISSFGPPALRPLPTVEEDRDALELMRALGYL